MKQPKQILKDHPEIAKAGYTAQDLGYLFRLGIVSGQKITREIVVNEKEVLKWFKNRIVKLNY